MSRPRLLFDADTRFLLASALTANGYDAIHARDLGMLTAVDDLVLKGATDQRRTVFTYNARDFMPLATAWAQAGREHAGIIVAGQAPFGEIRRRLLRMLSNRSAEDLWNVAQWLTP